MTRRHRPCTLTILALAMAAGLHPAEAAAQTLTDRRTSIGASLFFEAPFFGRMDTIFDQGGPRGLSPGVSVRIARVLSSRVGIGLEIDLVAAHIWRGADPTFVNETDLVDLPRVQTFRFDTYSPVLTYRLGSIGRWAFDVAGGVAFAHIRNGDVKAMHPVLDGDLPPTATDVAYTVGITTGLNAQWHAMRRLTVVTDVRATSLSFSGFRGFVIRPGVGIRFAF
jgi:hypothetical protein